jgi:ABC-type polysaccharide/polyol phosphate transport system ATPase subunit
MMEMALSMEHVYKRFSKAARHDTLRDLIPAAARRLFRRGDGEQSLHGQEFWALNDVSFQVSRGEALGIIGGNGAGKSTLLKHLSGIMRPTRGHVRVNGRLSALIEVGAGFHQDLSGRENVFLNGVILGMSREEIRRKFDDIVDFSGIAEFIDMPVKRYSSGMYARLGFSVAVHMEPDILLVDEALSVGDYSFQMKCVQRMREVVKAGSTIIFVSHNLRAVADMCTRSLLLSRGRIAADGPPSEVISKHLEQARAVRGDRSDQLITIEAVDVFAAEGKRFDFQSGESAIVEVRVRAHHAVGGVGCVLYLHDEQFYEGFNISTARLGAPPLTLEAGAVHTYRFHLDLNLASGKFYLSTSLYRHGTGEQYDKLEPATTLFVNSPTDVHGIANLNPRLL